MSVERGSVQLFEHKEETGLSKQIEQVSDGKKWNYNKLIKERQKITRWKDLGSLPKIMVIELKVHSKMAASTDLL